MYNITWRVSILPYLEQQALVDQLDYGLSFRSNVTNVNSDALSGVLVDAFVCPSNVVEPLANNPWGRNPRQLQSHNYIGINGGVGAPGSHCRRWYGWECDEGAFLTYKPVEMAQVTDGTSSTLMIGEHSGRDLDMDYQSYRQGFYGGWAGNGMPVDSSIGARWRCDANTTGITPIQFPLNTNCKDNNPDSWVECQVTYSCSVILNSEHPGGVQFALVDGSVRFISQDIELLLLKQLAMRNDGSAVQVP
jgi:prepilin-type processing-associated H-X9-DG protein